MFTILVLNAVSTAPVEREEPPKLAILKVHEEAVDKTAVADWTDLLQILSERLPEVTEQTTAGTPVPVGERVAPEIAEVTNTRSPGKVAPTP